MANAAIDLTTLSNVKGWLGITTETDDDATLTRLITSYSQWLQTQMGRALVAQVYADTIDGSDECILYQPTFSAWLASAQPGGAIAVGQAGVAIGLRQFPAAAVISLVVDGNAIPQGSLSNQQGQIDGYVLADSRRIEMLGPTYSFSRGVQNIAINYAAGYVAAAVAFTGSITGNTLTVTAVATGALGPGQALADTTALVLPATVITAQLSGTPGGIGTYSVSNTQTLASETLTVSNLTIPLDIEQAVIDLVVWRFKQKDRIGERAKAAMGGSEVQFFSDGDAPTAAAVIEIYRRINV